jgi:hypothetical protein
METLQRIYEVNNDPRICGGFLLIGGNEMRFSAPFGYYHFDGFKVDVFGYNDKTDRYVYSVETPYSSKVREAKANYITPRCRLGINSYINIIDPYGKKHRLFLD